MTFVLNNFIVINQQWLAHCIFLSLDPLHLTLLPLLLLLVRAFLVHFLDIPICIPQQNALLVIVMPTVMITILYLLPALSVWFFNLTSLTHLPVPTTINYFDPPHWFPILTDLLLFVNMILVKMTSMNLVPPVLIGLFLLVVGKHVTTNLTRLLITSKIWYDAYDAKHVEYD